MVTKCNGILDTILSNPLGLSLVTMLFSFPLVSAQEVEAHVDPTIYSVDGVVMVLALVILVLAIVSIVLAIRLREAYESLASVIEMRNKFVASQQKKFDESMSDFSKAPFFCSIIKGFKSDLDWLVK